MTFITYRIVMILTFFTFITYRIVMILTFFTFITYRIVMILTFFTFITYRIVMNLTFFMISTFLIIFSITVELQKSLSVLLSPLLSVHHILPCSWMAANHYSANNPWIIHPGLAETSQSRPCFLCLCESRQLFLHLDIFCSGGSIEKLMYKEDNT